MSDLFDRDLIDGIFVGDRVRLTMLRTTAEHPRARTGRLIATADLVPGGGWAFILTEDAGTTLAVPAEAVYGLNRSLR